MKKLKGVKWIEELKKFGQYWMKNHEMKYPNMCNKKDYEWKSYKELAVLNKELTLIWNIGIKEKLHKKEYLNGIEYQMMM